MMAGGRAKYSSFTHVPQGRIIVCLVTDVGLVHNMYFLELVLYALIEFGRSGRACVVPGEDAADVFLFLGKPSR